jgi:predicted transcriptional regulator of viral defense system
MLSVAEYIANLAAEGRYTFTTDEVVAALRGSVPAVRAQVRRLKKRGHIADPHRGFHVIVPPEYRRLGCLPADQFVPQLVDHLGESYYVALLSAAELHGAAHQRPQGFQVMVAKNRRPLACGQVRVQFIARADLARTPTIEKNTPRGLLRISSPEATALELVGYAERCGGLGNVMSVLADLVDLIDLDKFVEAARLSPIAWAQRLGYLLDLAGHREAAEALIPYVKEHALFAAPLVRKKSRAGAPRIERWKLVANATLEADQ